MTEHQSLDNYYTKEQTNSSITAAMDAIAVPQTYNIEWLMNLISTSTDGTVTLTAEQFNEIKAAYDAHKIFVAHSMVFSSGIILGTTTAIILATLEDNFVERLGVLSRNGTYSAILI